MTPKQEQRKRAMEWLEAHPHPNAGTVLEEMIALRAKLVLADRLAEVSRDMYCTILFTDFPDGLDFIFTHNKNVGIALAEYRKEGE